MTTTPQRPGADDERLATIRKRLARGAAGYPETWNWHDVEFLHEQLAHARAERDRAIAHDQQPYPTAEAYERVCALLKERDAEIARLRAPAGGDLVERAREIAREYFGTTHPGVHRLTDEIATFAATIQREAREACEAENNRAQKIIRDAAALLLTNHRYKEAVEIQREAREAAADIGLTAIRFAYEWIGGLPVTPTFEDKRAAQQALEEARDRLCALSGTAPQSGWRPIDDEAKTIDDDIILGRTSDIFRVLAQYDPQPDHEGYPWVAPEGARYHEQAFNRWHRAPSPPTEDATG